jgi:hypothetical protein
LLTVLGACLILAGALHVFGLDAVARVAPIGTFLVALVAAVIAGAAIWWNRRIARLKATLDLIEGSESKEDYQVRYRAFRDFPRADAAGREAIADPGNTETADTRAKCQDFLNHYELVAIACRHGLIDEGFYRAWMGPVLVRDWNEAVVLVRRARSPDGPSDPGSPAAYVEFEALARKWGGKRLPRQ